MMQCTLSRSTSSWVLVRACAGLPAVSCVCSSTSAPPRLFAPKVQCRLPAENLTRPVHWIVVQERAATSQLVLEIREPPARAAAVFIVLAANAKCDAITGRHHDRGRPQLDVELDRFARRQ